MPLRKIDPETFLPLGYRVLVRDDSVEQKTAGGIILTDQGKASDEHAQQFGTVVSYGDLAFSMETSTGQVPYKTRPWLGDVVVYSKYAGGQYHEDEGGQKYRLLNDDDIRGIVERAK